MVIRKEEYLNPADYPAEQRQLVEDFNKKLKNSMGVVTALGKEYHTIWIVRCDDLTMEIYRSTGESTVEGLVDMGLSCGTYDKFIEAYVDTYVVNGTDSLMKDVSPAVMLERIKDGSLYTVDYIRMNDDTTISYHQVAFALAGEPGKSEKFVLAFRDVDRVIRKHMADKLYLREQLDIVNALSRDYYNIFKIDLKTGKVVILKLDGYVTKGMEGPSEKQYDYNVLYKQYVTDRVFSEDIPMMMDAISLKTVEEKLKDREEYVASYRVMDNGEVHYYQFTYIPVNPARKDSLILAAFKNVDDVVETAKERDELISLAETDLMTGILNRGSGEQKVSNALLKGRRGMFCVIDIDLFKNINDTYGHDVGDKVIRGIADILKEEFRDGDIIFRLGGDEYAVFAQNVLTESKGRSIMSRVFTRIDQLKISDMDDKPISVSAGAVVLTRGSNAEFDQLYKKADEGVYKSKIVSGNDITFSVC